MGRKNRKPSEPITLNIPVFYLSFSFFVSLRELWTPWRTDGFLFISVLHCLAWGLACCQAQVCVCWMSEQTVKECPDPCYAIGLDSCWGLTVLNGMNCSAQRKTQQWTSIPRGASQRIWEMDGTARRGLRHVRPDPADERWTCDWGLTSDNPPWLEHARWGALVWILVFLGDLSRWKWHCGMQSHHLGTHLGELMTGKRQYMPKRALCKTKLPVTSYGQVSFSVGTVGRQSRAGTILRTFQSLLELSMALTSWTDPLGPLVPGPSDIKCPWVRKEMSFWVFFKLFLKN